ncbi:ABC transporter ATP-binding protein [Pelagibacterium limicola]|uniref:ABC transporter ATP-binding protein n=1 Tax=Pelagibacterium limicola TaxID=2791022 RepID=UPI0018AFEAD6|nr:ABC transporter ATP-binding protein [Pelagibacterium limicola]
MIGLENASVAFGKRTVLDKLNFNVPRGQCMAILGPNGRGKTTALRAMLGFQPLASGSRVAPQVVGYVPQYASASQSYSVREVVVMGRATGLGLFGQPRLGDYAAADSALERVGAERFSGERFDRLSGGERQLVLLARALATGSDVLVLDEPGSALDLANQQRLLVMLDGLRQQRDKAIVFTTHDPNHALAAADTALLMMPDGPALFGPVEEMIAPAPLEALYGVPMRLVEMEAGKGRTRAVLPAFAGRRAA